MKASAALVVLRVLTVLFSASLLGGYVWLSQRKAHPPVTMELEVNGEVQTVALPPEWAPGNASPVMPGSKSISQPIFSTRKIVNELEPDALDERGEPRDPFAPPAAPPAKGGMTLMPGSKSFSGKVVSVDAVNGLLGDARPEAPKKQEPKQRKLMPGSKAAVLEPEFMWTWFVRTPSEIVSLDPFAPRPVPPPQPPRLPAEPGF